MRIGQNLARILYRAARHTGVAEEAHDIVLCPCSRPFFDNRIEGIAVFPARRRIGEPRIVGQLRPADHAERRNPHRPLPGIDEHVIVRPARRRASAPGPKVSSSTSDFAMTSRNRRFPSALFRLRVRLRLLALNSRKKRLSESGLSRMLRRATSPPFGSSSLMTSAPKNARIWAQAGPAWLCVMSMMRIPDRALLIA